MTIHSPTSKSKKPRKIAKKGARPLPPPDIFIDGKRISGGKTIFERLAAKK